MGLAVEQRGNIRHLNITERPCSFAASEAFALLLVGCEVERDEEQEVRADNAHTSKCGKFLSSAVARVWHPWEVGRGEVGVRCEVDKPYN